MSQQKPTNNGKGCLIVVLVFFGFIFLSIITEVLDIFGAGESVLAIIPMLFFLIMIVAIVKSVNKANKASKGKSSYTSYTQSYQSSQRPQNKSYSYGTQSTYKKDKKAYGDVDYDDTEYRKYKRQQEHPTRSEGVTFGIDSAMSIHERRKLRMCEDGKLHCPYCGAHINDTQESCRICKKRLQA